MKRKSAHKTTKTPKKKIKGFFYYKKHLIVVSLLTFFILGGLLSLSKRQILTNNECANSISCIHDLSGNYEDENTGVFAGKPVTGPALAGQPVQNKLALTNTNVLGDTTQDSKHIYVDLTNQRLMAFENNTLVYEFSVSTGNPWTPTPTGDFRIWIKLRYTRMTGGSGAGYYNLPNVPYTMFFANEKVKAYQGYGIHGAYWHNNFGHPMSHGCVNMKEEDVAKLYEWATPTTIGNTTRASVDNPGTLITIYGETPKQ